MMLALAVLSLAVACGDDAAAVVPDAGAAPDATTPDAGPPDAGPREWPFAEVPAVTEPEPGILREVVRVPGADAPPNPMGGIDTPAEMDVVQVVRWRAAGDAPQARAVLVAMP